MMHFIFTSWFTKLNFASARIAFVIIAMTEMAGWQT
jgi:hypothetical protein